MTISSNSRKAGPFIGNGTAATFPFTFKVFQASDLEVVKLTVATNVETVLVLNTDFTAVVNEDQNSNPGGTITLSAGALATGYNLVITSDIENLQPTDLTNQGGFYPEVITDALDRATIQIQQLQEGLDRAALLPITSSADAASLVADIVRLADSADNLDIDANNIASIDAVAGSIANVNTVATNISNVNTVAGVSANVTTVATDIAAVNTVAADLNEPVSEIETVAGSITNVNTVGTNIANVNTVAGISDNVTTVAGISANVSTVATNSASVVTVATDIAAVQTVANDLNEPVSEIDTVATNIANVNTVGNNIASVNTAAGNNANITTVATDIANVNTVATNIANVNSVAGNATNINAVAGNSTNINAVATNSTNINTAATNIAAITTVANDLNEPVSEIDTVATNIANVNAVGSDIASVNTVAVNIADVHNFADVYQGAKSTPPTLRNDGSALQIGDLYFNSVSNAMFVYASTGWVPAGSSVNGTSRRFRYIATAGQTTFTGADSNGNTMAYDAGFVDVYLNGVRLDQTDYTATSGTSIVLASAAALSDELNIVAFGTFSVASINGVDIINGTVSANKLAAGAAVSNIGYTPVNKAGDTMTGQLINNAGFVLDTDVSSAPDGKVYLQKRSAGAYLSGYQAVIETGSAGSRLERLRVDFDGRVTMPFQPAFNATVSSGAPVALANGTVIPYPDIQLNVGSGFNASNNRFTAPVAGNYFFYGGFGVWNASGTRGIEFVLRKNGSYYARGEQFIAIVGGTNTHVSCQVSAVIPLAAGDYVDVFHIQSLTAINLYQSSRGNFSGHLIG